MWTEFYDGKCFLKSVPPVVLFEYTQCGMSFTLRKPKLCPYVSAPLHRYQKNLSYLAIPCIHSVLAVTVAFPLLLLVLFVDGRMLVIKSQRLSSSVT